MFPPPGGDISALCPRPFDFRFQLSGFSLCLCYALLRRFYAFVTAPTPRSPNVFNGCYDVTAPAYYIPLPRLFLSFSFSLFVICFTISAFLAFQRFSFFFVGRRHARTDARTEGRNADTLTI